MYVICRKNDPNTLRFRNDSTLHVFYDADTAAQFLVERPYLAISWFLRELTGYDWKKDGTRANIKREMRK